MNPWPYFDIAAKVALSKQDERHHRIGAVGLRNDGIMVSALNTAAKDRTPTGHAEARVSRKLDKNAEVFVARIRSNGEFALAKPCPGCQVFLRARRVKRVYYTIGPTEYGVLEF